jgi:hypothetical protein
MCCGRSETSSQTDEKAQREIAVLSGRAAKPASSIEYRFAAQGDFVGTAGRLDFARQIAKEPTRAHFVDQSFG